MAEPTVSPGLLHSAEDMTGCSRLRSVGGIIGFPVTQVYLLFEGIANANAVFPS